MWFIHDSIAFVLDMCIQVPEILNLCSSTFLDVSYQIFDQVTLGFTATFTTGETLYFMSVKLWASSKVVMVPDFLGEQIWSKYGSFKQKIGRP